MWVSGVVRMTCGDGGGGWWEGVRWWCVRWYGDRCGGRKEVDEGDRGGGGWVRYGSGGGGGGGGVWGGWLKIKLSMTCMRA